MIEGWLILWPWLARCDGRRANIAAYEASRLVQLQSVHLVDRDELTTNSITFRYFLFITY